MDRSTKQQHFKDVRPLAAYSVAVAAVAAATIARWLLDPVLSDNLPYTTYFLAVVVAAWYGGVRPAVLAIFLGLVLAWGFFVPPRFSFELKSTADAIGLVVFLVVCLSIAGFSGTLRAAERRSTRAEYIASEQAERLRTTLASIGDAVITTDIEGRLTNLNVVAESLTGWTNDLALGQPLSRVFNIVNEETRQVVENPVIKALREGVIVGLANHTLLIAKDGTERPIDDSAGPIRCKDGEIVGCVLVFRDITDRKQAELALLKSEERLRMAQRVAKIGTFDWNVQTGENRWTSELEAMYGLTPGGFAGTQQTWEQLVHPDDRQHAVERVQAALERGDFSDEWRVIWPDGSIHWLAGRASVFRDEQGEPQRLLGVNIDITEQKRAEEQVRRNERELTDFFDNATIGMHWVGPDGTILRANQAELDLLGYQADEYIGHPIAEFHVDQDVICDILSRLQAGEKLHDYEARLRCKDGSIRDVLISSSVLWENGQFIHTRCFTKDVTEWKRAEAELRRGSELLTFIIDRSPSGFYIVDSDFLISHINADSQARAFRNVNPAIGRRLGDAIRVLWPEPLATEIINIFRHTLDTGEPYRSPGLVSPRADLESVESYEWQLDRITMPDGTHGVVCYFYDTTQLREAEALVRQSEERYRTLVAQIKEHAIFRLDLQGRPTTWNEGVRQVLGFSEDEFIGQDIGRLIFNPEDVQHGVPQRELELAGRVGSASNDRWMKKKDGTRFWAAGITNALRDETGELIGYSMVMRDQTEVRELEEQLRELAANLSEADRRKDEFLATLAHELRNPLAPVRNAVQVIRLKGPDTPELRWGREVIERQVGHLTRLIDDLLDISRITRNKLELRKQRVELAEVVQGAVETSRPVIEQCGHELSVTLPEKPVYLNADLVRLAQVFMNLLTNAAKYTEERGRIWLTAEQQDGEVVVSVKDTGVGIPRDKLPNLFEMFFQVDRTLERAQGGLGIGLSLVRRLVELHGGTVEAHSEGQNKGSEFIVRLPVLTEPSKTERGEEALDYDAEANATSRRIVVVDDNKDSADTLAMLLRVCGNEVHTAHDGLTGVELVEKVLPEVVLLDIGMPKLNGYEACQRIRERPWGKSIILIALTGWGQDEDRQQTADAGFDAHLVKPVEHATLMKLLAELKPRQV